LFEFVRFGENPSPLYNEPGQSSYSIDLLFLDYVYTCYVTDNL